MKKCTVKQLDKVLSEMLSLVTALRENTILPEQFSRLDEILSTNPRARDHHAQIVKLYTDLEFLFKQNSHPIP